jgi:hypothetical protein
MRVRPERALSPSRATKCESQLAAPAGCTAFTGHLRGRLAGHAALYVLPFVIGSSPFAVTDTDTGRSRYQGKGFTRRLHPFASGRSSRLYAAACGVALVTLTLSPCRSFVTATGSPPSSQQRGYTVKKPKGYP